MVTPQLITDFMRLMLLLAPSARRHLPGAVGTQSAAGIGSRRVDRREFREMDVLGDHLSHSAPAHQLVPFVRSAGVFAWWRHRYRMDGNPSKRPRELCAEFCPDQAHHLLCRVL